MCHARNPSHNILSGKALVRLFYRLQEIREKYGNESIMVTGSSRGPGNEVNFVMQKFARAVLGNNNIDCCARV